MSVILARRSVLLSKFPLPIKAQLFDVEDLHAEYPD
jgi:hypothetical protein